MENLLLPEKNLNPAYFWEPASSIQINSWKMLFWHRVLKW